MSTPEDQLDLTKTDLKYAGGVAGAVAAIFSLMVVIAKWNRMRGRRAGKKQLPSSKTTIKRSFLRRRIKVVLERSGY